MLGGSTQKCCSTPHSYCYVCAMHEEWKCAQDIILLMNMMDFSASSCHFQSLHTPQKMGYKYFKWINNIWLGLIYPWTKAWKWNNRILLHVHIHKLLRKLNETGFCMRTNHLIILPAQFQMYSKGYQENTQILCKIPFSHKKEDFQILVRIPFFLFLRL